MTEARDMPTSDKQDALEAAARLYTDQHDGHDSIVIRVSDTETVGRTVCLACGMDADGTEQYAAIEHSTDCGWVALRAALAALDASPRPEVQEDEFEAMPEWGPHEPGLPQDYGYEPDETPDAKSEPREVQEEAEARRGVFEAITSAGYLPSIGTRTDIKDALADYAAAVRGEAEARIAALTAQVAAARRLLDKHYMPWPSAGGPNECEHGYAEGIPCQRCDRALLAGPTPDASLHVEGCTVCGLPLPCPDPDAPQEAE